MTSVPDYLTDDDLSDLGLDSSDVARMCPWAVPLTGHDGIACWDAADLEPLFSAKGDEQ
jgi:hypothetical protein